ncbi:hypothetical protein PLIP_a1956 [Pseudoalteromonas lipolytica LMEB 39]|nr:hypothetical protein [Pseudoalteromonas lipolytica LMEB 39]
MVAKGYYSKLINKQIRLFTVRSFFSWLIKASMLFISHVK